MNNLNTNRSHFAIRKMRFSHFGLPAGRKYAQLTSRRQPESVKRLGNSPYDKIVITTGI